MKRTEQKLACMSEPIDMPATRDMNVTQKTEYLDTMFRHFTEAGFILTQPERDMA